MLKLDFRVDGAGYPAIVQAPAWGPASHYLRTTLVPLLDGLRVVTFDARNTGSAPRVEASGSQSLEVLIADLDDVRERAGMERFALIGHSHGGVIAMAYAVRNPQRVAALLLLSTDIEREVHGEESERILRELERDPARRDAVGAYRAAPRPTGIAGDAELSRWLRATMPVHFYDLDAMRAFQRRLIGSAPPSAVAYRGVPEHTEAWVRDGLGELRVPTLIVVGSHDVTTPPGRSRRLQRLIPGSELVVLDRAGHNPWAERPEEFRCSVAGFLERHALVALP